MTVFVPAADDVEVLVTVVDLVGGVDAVDVREDVEEAVLVYVIRGVNDPFTLALELGLAVLDLEELMDFVAEGEADEVRDTLVDAVSVGEAVVVLEDVIEEVAVFDDVAVRVEDVDAVEVLVPVADFDIDVEADTLFDGAAVYVDVIDL